MRFERSQIEFARFPFRLSEPVLIRWHAGGIRRINRGTFTLRRIEEAGVDQNQGDERYSQEEIWSSVGIVKRLEDLGPGGSIELIYILPPEALGTQINSYEPRFWELEVKLDLPGLNFRNSYLVPIYG